MRKTWLASAASLCLGLAVATSYVLLTPVSALAATGYANCKDAPRVTCDAYICACTDNAGCIAVDASGKQTAIPCGVPTRSRDGDGGPAPVETNN